MWIPFVIFAVVVAVLVWRERMVRRYKAQLLQSALTAQERMIIARAVPLVARMPQSLRDQLEGKVCLFLD